MKPLPSDLSEHRAAAALFAASLALTAIFALPVLVHPHQRLVGREIVGRHPDAYTYIEHFEAGLAFHSFTQPATDWPAAILAAVWDGVVAYNLIVLLGFPLTALATFLLARRLGCRPRPAALCALLFAFAPIHLAHTAYHPHVTQIQWLPVLLLTLVWLLEKPGWRPLLAFTTAAVVLVAANFYAALQLAVLAPAAALAYWSATPRGGRADAARGATAAVAALVVLMGGGLLWLRLLHPEVLAEWGTIGEFPDSDLSIYSARWWSYLLPPVGHPLFGGMVERFWQGHPLAAGKVEQQLDVGVAALALAIFAAVALPRRVDATERRSIRTLTVIAAVAFLFSLPPRLEIAGHRVTLPSQLFHLTVPMFRAYARVGILVVLAVLLLAALALGHLLDRGGKPARVASLLAVIAVMELTPLPPWRWHWVLPTAAHRWLATETGELRILDCTEPTLGEQNINSLMPHPTSILGIFSRPPREGPVRRFWTDSRLLDPVRPISDCAEPDLPGKLAAMGYTHVLVRADYRLAENLPAEGLRLEREFPDSAVYRVTAPPASIYTREIAGFSWRAGGSGSTHRWMGPAGFWTVVNTAEETRTADLEIDLISIERPREVIVLLGDQEVTRLATTTRWDHYRVEDLLLVPGPNRLTFVPTGRPTVPAEGSDSHDQRALTIAVGAWRWETRRRSGPPSRPGPGSSPGR